MNQYVTGAMIRRLREEKKITQQQMADAIGVSDKAISKWETGRGYPDITLIEPIAAALGVSVIELFAGADVVNTNKVSNMLRMNMYVCPVCGNVVQSTGEAVISCCGITLPPLEAELSDEEHMISLQRIDDELFVSVEHPMEKDHFISFIAAVSDHRVQLLKLYPEGNAEGVFKIDYIKKVFAYCNRHGLYEAAVTAQSF